MKLIYRHIFTLIIIMACTGFAHAQYFAGSTSSDKIYNIDEYGYAIDSITVTMPGYTVFGFNGLDTDDSGQLYALIQTVEDFTQRAIAKVNVGTGVATLVGFPGIKFSGIAFGNGVLYAISGDNINGDAGGVPETLYSINLTTGSPTLFLSLGNGDDGETIAFNDDDGYMYHMSGYAAIVFEKIDLVTKSVTDIPFSGDLPGGSTGLAYAGNGVFVHNGFGDINYIYEDGFVENLDFISITYKGLTAVPRELPDLADGKTYSLGNLSGMLYQLNISNGESTDSIPLTASGLTVIGGNGLSIDPTSGEMYAILKMAEYISGRALATIDPSTGVATVITNTGRSIASIAFTNDGRLFAVTGDGDNTLPSALYEVNKSDGSLIFRAQFTSGDSGEAISFNPDDGKLYHASGISNMVIESVDVNSYAISPVATYIKDFAVSDFLYAGNNQFMVVGWDNLSIFNLGDNSLNHYGWLDHFSKGLAFEQPIVIPTLELAAYYPFSGNTIEDLGSGYNGIIFGNPILVDDRFGNAISAYEFDGDDDMIQVNHGGTFGDIDDFTINAWVKPNVNDEWNFVLWDDGFSYPMIVGGENLEFHYNQDGVNFPSVNSAPIKLQKGLWNMVTMRGANNGDLIEMFINGEWAGVQYDVSGRLKSIGTVLQIGGRDQNPVEAFNGTLDDIRIYNGFIDNEEIKALYAENNWQGDHQLIANFPFSNASLLDISGFDNHMTDIGGGIMGATDRFGSANGALDFSTGQGFHYRADNTNHPQGNVTVSYSLWEYHNAGQDGNFISAGENTSNSRSSIYLYSDGRLEYVGSNNDFTSVAIAPSGRWNHIVMTKNGNNIMFYVNGILADEGSISDGQNLINTDIYLGSNPIGTEVFAGLLDDVKVYTYSITESEVVDLFNEGFVPGPIVTMSPSFASGDDEITITYDATQGDRGLLNAPRVYSYMGANDWTYVKGTWGVDDGIQEMSQVAANLWEITLSPDAKSWFGTTDELSNLVMVFRSPDGAQKGSGLPNDVFSGGYTAANGDIYLDLASLTDQQKDSLALVDLYNNTNGPGWFNTWDLLQPMSTWYGVVVDGNNRVAQLNLSGNNLIGTLPQSLSNLTVANHIDMAYNDFSGSVIPPSFGNLSGLFFFSLASSNISGPIPSELGNLSNLTHLILHQNSLTGNLPSTLGNLSNLYELNLWGNQLDGDVLPELGNNTQLAYLVLSENNFTGTIPTSLGNLTNLLELWLGANNLTGSIPSELGSLTSAEIITLYDNALSGEIPASFSSLTSLNYFSVGGNQLTGSIPSFVGNWLNLKYLVLRENLLTGQIPMSLTSNMDSLRQLTLHDNLLSGTIPAELGNITTLEGLALHNNNFDGDVPVELSALTNLEWARLQGNNFTGMADFTGAPLLSDLSVEDNKLTFEDLLLNATLHDTIYHYSPQQKAGEAQTLFVEDGTDVLLSYGFDSLVLNSNYDWYLNNVFFVRTASPQLTLNTFNSIWEGEWTMLVTNSNLAGITLETEPINVSILCSSYATDAADSKVTLVSVGSYSYNSSGSTCETYTDNKSALIELETGEVYDLTIGLGTCYGLYDKGARVFIDWNGDGDFEDTDEVVLESTISDTDRNETVQITVPLDAITSGILMRVIVRELDTSYETIQTIDPCGTYVYGETEDYTITVLDAHPDLVAEITDIAPSSIFNEFTPIQAGSNIQVSGYISNIGMSDAGVFDVEIQLLPSGGGASISLGSVSAPGLIVSGVFSVNSQTVLIPGSTLPGSYYVELVADINNAISESDENNNRWQFGQLIYVTTPPDVEPPTISFVNASTSVIEGSTANITFRATDNLGLGTVELWGKQITGNNFNLLPLSVNGDEYTFVLSSTDYDAIGYEFYARAVDLYSNETTTSTRNIYIEYADGSLALTPSSFGSDQSNYRMFSIPAKSTALNTVFAALGTYDDELWRVFRYQNGSNVEKKSGNIDPGNGYWLIVKDRTDIDFGGVETVNVSSVQPHIININSDWTQIGNPYNFNISWDDILQYNISNGNIASGEVGSSLRDYSGAWNDQSNFSPLKGYFIENLGGGSFSLEIPANINNGARVKRDNPELNPIDSDNWSLTFGLQNSQQGYNISGVGMNPGADSGLDYFDEGNVPRFLDHLEVRYLNDDFGGKSITQEVVAPADSHIWKFEVITSFEAENTILSWDNSRFGNNDFELMLLDKETQTVVDLREQNSYTFFLSGAHEFELYYGNKLFIDENLKPSVATLGHGYPNPFKNSTLIPFSLAGTSNEFDVELSIFNSLGQRVTTLENGIMATGFYRAEWDGTSNTGVEVNNGIYIYRLTIVDGAKATVHNGKLIRNQ